MGSPTDIDTERFPGKRLLKNALAQIAGEKEAIGAFASEDREESHFGNPNVLRFIDYHKVERSFATVCEVVGNATEHFRPGDEMTTREFGANPFENRPQEVSLLGAEAGLAPKARRIPVRFPCLQLPGIDDVRPLPE